MQNKAIPDGRRSLLVPESCRLLRRAALLAFSLGIVPLAMVSGDSMRVAQKTRPSHSRSSSAVYRNTAPGVKYVGSKVCAECHQEIYDEFIKTGMGRSMCTVGPTVLEKVPEPVTVFSKKLNRRFQVYRKGSDLFQSEYELDASGTEVFRSTQKIAFIVGSGANGFSCVVRRGDHLFEAPLSFYTRANSWGLSPGYEFRDYGFDRPIHEACAACHSGRAQPVPSEGGLYRDPPFRELAISCENCHGPGELHVKERMEAAPIPSAGDTSIVNPAKLPPWLANNICMYCHQAGDVRVLQPGKDYLDFRPGTPVDDTLAILMVPLKKDTASRPDLLEHYFSMTVSKCYRMSGGRLSCLSCHDPHLQPAKPDAATYYRKKCQGCHTEASCAVPLRLRQRQNPPDDCVGCHMPKRDTKVIAHSALTNHRILADPGEPFPEAAFHATSPATPDLIHLSAVPTRKKDSVPAVTLLEAYSELMNSAPVYRDHYEAMLGQLAKSEPNSIPVLEALASRAIQQGNSEGDAEAIQYLSRAIKMGSHSPRDFQALATLLARAGRLSEAIDLLRRAVQASPYDSELYRLLARAYLTEQKPGEAAEALEQALRTFPQDRNIRRDLKKLQEPGSPQ